MQNKGFTLIEAMLCLAILAILTSIAAPSFSQWQQRAVMKRATEQLFKQLAFTRQQAISTQKPITLCASIDGSNCSKSKNWTGLKRLAFFDENRNLSLDNNETAFIKNTALDQNIELFWRAFGNKSYIRWQPSGLTDYQSGNFTFCPSNKIQSNIQQIILNANGRAYFATDKNNDGIVENSQGKNVQCK